MAKIVNAAWKEERRNAVDDFFSPARIPIEPIVISFNKAAQWYITYLDSKNLKCKVINLGAGGKRIIHIDNICPHCKGKGVI